MKTGIYAYCLYKIFKLSYDRVLIEEVISGLLKRLKDPNFIGKFFHLKKFIFISKLIDHFK